MTGNGRIRKIGGIAVCAAALLLAGLWAGVPRGALRVQTQEIASATLGVAVTIEDIAIDRAAKTVILQNVRVASPAGFSAPHIMTIERIHMGTRGLQPELLHFGDVAVTGMVVYSEATAQGANLMALSGLVKPAATAEAKTDEGMVRHAIVKRVDIADARLQVVAMPDGSQGGDVITLPDIVLRSIGERQNGVMLSAAIAQIADHVIRVAAQGAGQAGFYAGMAPESLRAMQERLQLSLGMSVEAADEDSAAAEAAPAAAPRYNE